jgi:calcineurin-like phosphoesterase family protein
MSNTYFISDLHMGHSKMLEYESRPFKDIYEQDSVFIHNWNKVVKQEYYVYVLGDVSFYPKGITRELINLLNGRKILIMGNHDRHKSVKYWQDVGFEIVSKYPICYENRHWLSHEPMYLDDNSIYKNIHGHLHSKGTIVSSSTFNASVENINYTPISLEKIIKKMSAMEN